MRRVFSFFIVSVLSAVMAAGTVAAQQTPADTVRTPRADTAAVDAPATPSAPQQRPAVPRARTTAPDVTGTAVLADWPPSLSDLLDRMGQQAPRLLPKIDTLMVDYAYSTGDDVVDMRFGLQWTSGESVLYRGDVIPRSEGPPDVRMSSFEILLEVVTGGRKVAETVIAVDSMALPPAPGYYEFNVRVPYEQVFLDMDARTAESYLKEGVTLERPLIEVMGFREFRNGQPFGDVQTSRSDEAQGDRRRTEAEPAPVVYRPRTSVLIGWRIAPDPYYIGPAPVRGRSPSGGDNRVVERPGGDSNRTGRAATSGRPTGSDSEGDSEERTGRTTAASGDSDKSGKQENGSSSSGRDEDDEDDDDLAGAALGAAAVVAGVAYFGGTVGLYGTGETPLGLTAGVTKRKGGVHLQAAINPEVIDQEGTQRLTVKALGFYDLFGNSIVQPAIGVGVQAIAIDDNTELEPAVSVGAVLNTGAFTLFSGYDFTRSVPEFGLAYNFRYSSSDR